MTYKKSIVIFFITFYKFHLLYNFDNAVNVAIFIYSSIFPPTTLHFVVFNLILSLAGSESIIVSIILPILESTIPVLKL